MNSISLIAESFTQLISLGGVELPNSRRYLDLETFQAVRWQYQASSGLVVRLDYSTDDGATFIPLVDEYQTFGSGLRCTSWQVIPEPENKSQIMLRGFAIGSGLLTTVNFVQVDFQ